MKKYLKLAALALSLTLCVTGCSKTETTETPTETESASAGAEGTESPAEESTALPLPERGEYNPLDYVTINGYMNMEFVEADYSASEADIQAQLDLFCKNYAEEKEITDRAVENGDTVNIDFEGLLDGVAFDGGTAQGYDLVIGSHSFIDGFEDKLIGAQIGEKRALDLSFPDPYPNNPDLAGKPVVFNVTVNSIKASVAPELTDELVAKNTDSKTIEELKGVIAKNILNNRLADAFMTKLMDNAQFKGEYPESLVEYYYQYVYRYYCNIYGSDNINGYMTANGQDVKAFAEEVESAENLENQVKRDLILGAIAQMEEIKAEGEDFDAFLAEYVEQYNYESKEDLIAKIGEEEVAHDYLFDAAYRKAFDSIVLK